MFLNAQGCPLGTFTDPFGPSHLAKTSEALILKEFDLAMEIP